MASPAPLGEFELMVLMAALHLAGDGHGSPILEVLERRSGRRLSRGAVYITLDRLEEKGLLASRTSAGGPPSRGGRPKRLFRVTAAGVRAMKHSLGMLARMYKGLEPVLGEI